VTPEQRGLRDRLAEVPARLARAAARARPVAGEWSAAENVRHLIAVEDHVWHARLEQLAREPDPHWPWIEPPPASFPGDDSLDTVLARFASGRAETVARLDGLDDAGWAHTGTHATFGVLDVTGLMTKAIDHDEEHIASLEAR
jgi:DinB family protein